MKPAQITLCLVSTLISLSGLELIARYQLHQQAKLRLPVYIADHILGFKLKQSLQVKPTTNTFRILMLGDSFTQGNEVPVDKTFSKILEHRLNQSLERTYEVINAGIRGGSPIQYYLWLKTEGLKLNYDLIILNFYLGNDITDALMFNVTVDAAGLATKLTLKDTYVDAHGYLRRRQTHFSLCELSAFCRLYLRPKPVVANWDSQAWQLTRQHLLAIKRLAALHQSQFILTLIPEAANFDTPVHQLLLDFAAQNNIKLIDFTPMINLSMYDTLDRHWNESGHQKAAQVSYEYFLSL